MNEDPSRTEPGVEPLHPATRLEADPDSLHVGPEMAITETDFRSGEDSEFVRGTSLWKDAWRRLLKNKLAVFGMIVVIIITIASVIGPALIKRILGFTPDYIPTNDIGLVKSFPPFTAPNGNFS